MDSLDLALDSSDTSLTWTALQLGQLQVFLSNALVALGAKPGSISDLLAVLYALYIAAPNAVATKISAINRIIAVVSIVLNKQELSSAADAAHVKSQEWQDLRSAVGFHPVYLPAVLAPASKAVLIQLEAAAACQHTAVIRLQVLLLACACQTHVTI